MYDFFTHVRLRLLRRLAKHSSLFITSSHTGFTPLLQRNCSSLHSSIDGRLWSFWTFLRSEMQRDRMETEEALTGAGENLTPTKRPRTPHEDEGDGKLDKNLAVDAEALAPPTSNAVPSIGNPAQPLQDEIHPPVGGKGTAAAPSGSLGCSKRRWPLGNGHIADSWAYFRSLGSPRFHVAPMVDQSELPFRLLCRKYGAEAAYTPMLHSRLFSEDVKYRREFTTCPEDRPLFVQFCSNCPDTLLAAAQLVAPVADYVDINLGCPQRIAKRGNYGAFLMDDLPLIKTMVEKLATNLEIPVSCKIRMFPSLDKTIEYARMLETAGCALLAVHGRTRDQKDQKAIRADWEVIRLVREAVKIPVLANGNVRWLEDAEECMRVTGVQGVMSAESLLENPALFAGVRLVGSNGGEGETAPSGDTALSGVTASSATAPSVSAPSVTAPSGEAAPSHESAPSGETVSLGETAVSPSPLCALNGDVSLGDAPSAPVEVQQQTAQLDLPAQQGINCQEPSSSLAAAASCLSSPPPTLLPVQDRELQILPLSSIPHTDKDLDSIPSDKTVYRKASPISPPIDQISLAREYLALVDQHSVPPRMVRAHIHKLLGGWFRAFPDIRENLNKAFKITPDFLRGLVEEIEQRRSRDPTARPLPERRVKRDPANAGGKKAEATDKMGREGA
eukprot:TRINITY_DN30474_c0_g1_i1.p1 TRINITY_DN30474_c0_g1~~TRINITY_DN30474_c0_g1_i1.p1  ORF type:complete len:674 (+),score=91.79 TRINITY_DN30474_c0_g1_i1:130-2151(+)